MFGIPTEILFGMVTGILSFFAKQSAYKRQDQKELMELALRQNSQNNDHANDAAKRSSPVFRKYIALIIILVSFGGLLYMGIKEQETAMLIAGKSKSVIFGLFKWETDPKIITTTGFFLADYIKYGVIQVVSFLFGGSLAKASR